jgi:hypothetical protein
MLKQLIVLLFVWIGFFVHGARYVNIIFRRLLILVQRLTSTNPIFHICEISIKVMIRFAFIVAVLAAPVHLARGQLSLTQRYYPRVIIPSGITYVVESNDIVIDTLIMDNRGSMQFKSNSTRILVRHAVIGKKCSWDARASGMGLTGSGNNGKNLAIEIRFEKLGQLTIDTRGALGSRGTKGGSGVPGANGSTSGADGGPGGNGGPGGRGGDGGDLTLRYACTGFEPVMERAKRNSLILKYQGGDGGRGGSGGPGGQGGMPVLSRRSDATGTVTETNGVRGLPGATGSIGFSGEKGRDGVLVLEKILN